ncbi:hypothetical protein M2323_001264 [Rhodoblastus acidophilus]|uniref:right-handed parallel beta-helix repeat-containing protein n=1 Tax=Rhodoblastus acidophilus TaxID=1074 RepID=UPI002225764A|nr:right-handed parallel beta-helix repeat-containing protein [Rhodoblastus acidophilus]MCW2283322.1 hypothetical protein [Rhodoblastus acidophilus]MCW2332354.1 hypothetical protein [Rhodoblastus acidophilus]
MRGALILCACALATSAFAETWPDAHNTGVPPGVILKPSGDLTITEAGAMISGLDIRGAVTVKANNVTLVNCRITAATFSVVKILEGVTGTTVKSSEIDGVGDDNEGSNGIDGQGTFLANNIHDVENGLNITGPSVIRDNYIHDLRASGSPHYDGIQIDGGHDVVISHNTVVNDHDQTSAVMIDNYFKPISNISVEGNRLLGGGYAIYSDGQFNGGPISGVSIIGNRLGKGKWGYAVVRGNSPVWRGNVDDASGQALGAD